MSKRAEQAALRAYPYETGVKGLICEQSRVIFIKGYEQAEKDLALTCEDVAYIVDTFYAVEGSVKEKCEEVLRRFNEYKKLV